MRGALENNQFAGIAFAGESIDESVLVVYAATPASVHVAKRFRLPNAGISISINVFDEQVNSFEDFLVFQLPASIFIPGTGSKTDIHGQILIQASISSCRLASPRLYDSIA